MILFPAHCRLGETNKKAGEEASESSKLITIKCWPGRKGKEQHNKKLKEEVTEYSTSKAPKGTTELPHRTLTAGYNDEPEEK